MCLHLAKSWLTGFVAGRELAHQSLAYGEGGSPYGTSHDSSKSLGCHIRRVQ